MEKPVVLWLLCSFRVTDSKLPNPFNSLTFVEILHLLCLGKHHACISKSHHKQTCKATCLLWHLNVIHSERDMLINYFPFRFDTFEISFFLPALSFRLISELMILLIDNVFHTSSSQYWKTIPWKSPKRNKDYCEKKSRGAKNAFRSSWWKGLCFWVVIFIKRGWIYCPDLPRICLCNLLSCGFIKVYTPGVRALLITS